MNKKRMVVWAVIVAVLGALVYLQFREWRHFNWHVFLEQTGDTNKLYLVNSILLIYATYILRALRWRIFLRPSCRTKTSRLIAPTLIGFTGLSLLGRPGELARPYLIARKENLTMSSQMAVWAVERIFDIGAFTVMMAIDIFTMNFNLDRHLRPFRHAFMTAGSVLIVLVIAMALGAIAVRRNGEAFAGWVERRMRPFAPHMAQHIAAKIHAFGEGLNTIHDFNAFLQLTGVSLLIWFLIALSYEQVTRAYPPPLRHWSIPYVVLLIGFSMVGSLIQLPAVGGGAQLATIKGMQAVFGVRPEMAVSCGIMLWLVTFMAVVPLGLALAHREHVSLTRITQEGAKVEEAAERAELRTLE
jgi:uncharacterized protein (TIRG00374 family)